MFFIAGTDSRTTTVDQGSFFCPTCDQEQTYEHKVVEKIGTIFFMSVGSLEELGRYIECEYCGETFHEEVLEYQPGPTTEDVEAEYRKAIKYVIVAMSLADGKLYKSEVDAMYSMIFDLTGQQATSEELKSLARRVKNDGNTVVDYLGSVAPYLNDSGKEMIITALLHVAAADGNFHKQELTLIGEACAVFDISDAHLKGIVGEFNESQPSTKVQ
jgi:uncharacterized tellurite resistance protein B-like protein